MKTVLFKSINDMASFRFPHLLNEEYKKRQTFIRKFRVIYENTEVKVYNKNSEYPHVFCAKVEPQDVLKDIKFINRVCGQHKNLIWAGDGDKPHYDLYDHKIVDKLKKNFDNIFLETLRTNLRTKDSTPPDCIKTFPMGFTTNYLQNADHDILLQLVNCSFNIQKEKLIGTAFGKKWPSLNRNPDRRNLLDAVKDNKLIENFFCDFSEYHLKKSKYKYFASPLGNGIQAPKIYESMMCETVPVLTDELYARQLRDLYNLPIYIIDEWKNLNEKHLIETYENEYKNYDWCSLKKKFHVDNFIDEFLNNK
jgi:hypothetical protein